MEGIDTCLDVGPQRFNDILVLVPTRLAANSRVVCLYEPGQ
jgi:hypothetical protein